MRIVVDAGTNVGALGVADPALLTGLRQALYTDRYAAARDEAARAGALWRADLRANGTQRVHLFVDEDPPAELHSHFVESFSVDAFQIRSGRLLVGGEECLSGAEPPSAALGREIDVPPGLYELTAFRVASRKEVTEQRWNRESSPEQRRAWARGDALAASWMASAVAGAAGGLLVYRSTESLLSACALLLVPAAVLGYTRWYRSGADFQAAEALFQAIESDQPSFVVVLKRLA